MEPQDLNWIEAAVNLGVPLLLLALGYFVGRIRELRHYRSIRAREARYRGLPVTSFRPQAEDLKGMRGDLVMGHVSVANDYFKTFVAGLKKIFGGRLRSHETLLDRARREAVLRMLRQAELKKAVMVVNMRLETSLIGQNRQGNGGSVEVFAYATALTPR